MNAFGCWKELTLFEFNGCQRYYQVNVNDGARALISQPFVIHPPGVPSKLCAAGFQTGPASKVCTTTVALLVKELRRHQWGDGGCI